MERRYDTVEAQRLFAKVLDRDEYEAWDLLLNRLERAPSSQGPHELRIRSAHRVIVATVYASRALGALYVLSYHLERAKEPTARQVETVQAYIAEIKRLEKEHS